MTGPSGCLPQKFRIYIESELISLKCVNLVVVGVFSQLAQRLSIPVVESPFLNLASEGDFCLNGSAGA